MSTMLERSGVGPCPVGLRRLVVAVAVAAWLPVMASAAVARHKGASTDATVALTTQPGSALETTATMLVAGDLKQSRNAGDPPVMLVGSASVERGARAGGVVRAGAVGGFLWVGGVFDVGVSEAWGWVDEGARFDQRADQGFT